MRLAVISCWLVAGACHGRAVTPASPAPASVAASPVAVPAHLRHIRELYARAGDRIVEAPAEDQRVAQGYPTFGARGPVAGGLQMTIMTAKTHYRLGEDVRVVHVVEVGAGHSSYVMGPKPIHGEYVDGALRTTAPPTPDYPWATSYDGAVLPGPDADVNFEVTRYRFDFAGRHRIEWRLGALRSNVIDLDVR